MEKHVCPWWIGYLLLSPIRRFLEHPDELLAPWVEPGMRVLEVGPGMGFFTLPLARMVGESGKVVATDVQTKMLETLKRRARRKGLEGRIETRVVEPGSLGVDDLEGTFDVVAALHVVHELPDAGAFFTALAGALRPGGRVVFMEPAGHVTAEEYRASLVAAEAAGFVIIARPKGGKGRRAVLESVLAAA